jgi:lipid II:glycine glycyltransferase (peptidoglycan interpeptide bridge formation enzyme)
LIWNTILDAKADGVEELDLGRSDLDNPGLIEFKNRWGSSRGALTYWRMPLPSAPAPTHTTVSRIITKLVTYAPNTITIQAGNLLYRHLG